MSFQDRRIARGWTQEQLALHAGISTRTIQRIEHGKAATLETLKCLAAVFETDVHTLMQEQNMSYSIGTPQAGETLQPGANALEQDAITYVQNLKGFHMNWITYVIIIPALAILNIMVSPEFYWVIIVAVAWGAGILLHAILLFGLFGFFDAEWEQREFRKRIHRFDH